MLFDSSTSPAERKERGHFGTSPAIAQFMAGFFSKLPDSSIRILDPGAGVGTLTAAFCQRLMAERKPREVYVELWENDQNLNRIYSLTSRYQACHGNGAAIEAATGSDEQCLVIFATKGAVGGRLGHSDNAQRFACG